MGNEAQRNTLKIKESFPSSSSTYIKNSKKKMPVVQINQGIK